MYVGEVGVEVKEALGLPKIPSLNETETVWYRGKERRKIVNCYKQRHGARVFADLIDFAIYVVVFFSRNQTCK